MLSYFFLTYFCQIDLETNYLNDYLVDLRTQVSLISGYILVLEGYHNSHWIMKRIKMLCFLFNLFKDDENVILIITS